MVGFVIPNSSLSIVLRLPTVKVLVSTVSMSEGMPHTAHSGLGGSRLVPMRRRSRRLPRIASLHQQKRHSSLLPLRILSASSTMKPEMIALVLAIAGMMRPAVPLASQRDSMPIPKHAIRKLEAAVRKSIASLSSLSKLSKPTSSARCSRILVAVARKTAVLSATVHAAASGLSAAPLRAVASGRAVGAVGFGKWGFEAEAPVTSKPMPLGRNRSGTGGDRSFSFHVSCIRAFLLISSSNTARNTRQEKSKAASPGSCIRGAGAAAGEASSLVGSAWPALASRPSASLSVSMRSVLCPPKSSGKRSSFTQWIQCTGVSGWLRIVQTG